MFEQDDDGPNSLPGPVAVWFYLDALQFDEDPKKMNTLLLFSENERSLGHYVSWFPNIDDCSLGYLGKKSIAAASSAVSAAIQEPRPANYSLELAEAMRQGLPRGISLHTHYTLEKARDALEHSDRVLNVKEQQRVRREQQELKRAEQREQREKEKQEKLQKEATQGASQPSQKSAKPRRKPPPKAAAPPPDRRTREEVLRDKAAAGMPAGKSMKTVKMVQRNQELRSQLQTEEYSSSSEGSQESSDASHQSVSPASDDPDRSEPAPVMQQSQSSSNLPVRKLRPLPGVKLARKRLLSEAKAAAAESQKSEMPSPSPSPTQLTPAQELLQRVHHPEVRKNKKPE